MEASMNDVMPMRRQRKIKKNAHSRSNCFEKLQVAVLIL